MIKEGKTDYLQPVEEDLVAVCLSPEEIHFEKFIESFKRKGMGRITLKAHIKNACSFEGVFVAQKSSEPRLG